MGRKCSHCGNIGHNSRTCNFTHKLGTCVNVNMGGGGLRIFGVQLDVISSPSYSIPIKKSFSLDCLSSSSPSSASSSLSSSRVSIAENCDKMDLGYLSDGLLGRVQERKKGVPWTEEEHKMFLIGLEKQGKGDWRGISRNFVSTRTPTQVASHAQKYFLRQASLNKKKRRSSLFDLVESKNTTDSQVNDDDDTVVVSAHDYDCEYIHTIRRNNQEDNQATMTIVSLNNQEEEDQAASHHHSMSWLWRPCESLRSSQSTSSVATKMAISPRAHHVNVVDLELTLAAPQTGSQQSSSSSFLMGPIISVI